MKKLFLLAFILLLSISLSGCVKGEDCNFTFKIGIRECRGSLIKIP